MKWLIKLILKLIGKNEKIKKAVVDYLDNENDKIKDKESLATEETIKEDFDINKYIEFQQNNYFSKTKEKDVIFAATPDWNSEDLSHLIRPFLVIGKEDGKLKCVYSTSQDKYKNSPKYCKRICNDGKESYFRCDKIYLIDKERFYKKYYVLPDSEYEEVLCKLTENCKEFDNPNFSDPKRKIFKNAVVLVCGKYYAVSEVKEEKGVFEALKLSVTNNTKDSFRLQGKNYTISDNNPIRIRIKDVEKIVFEIPDHFKDKLRASIKKSYELGDVLSLKDTKGKVIYLTKDNKYFYCLYMSQLDFFTGICMIPKEKVVGYYRSLDESEISKLIYRVERPLSNDNYSIYTSDDIRDSILDNISKIKEM